MDTRIHVNFHEVTGKIDRRIYGHFIENVDVVVYGGIWLPPGSDTPTLRGMRIDVLELVKDLRAPVMRLPGGAYSEHYHWEDGIGPLEKRRWRYDWMWLKLEPNMVGTHEYLDFCAEVGAEPVICVNISPGTTEEAARWVAYCNDPPDTEQGRRRTANGRREPWNVKIWGVGNELWDLGAERYGEIFLEYAEAMRQADPGIELVAIGCTLRRREWDPTLLRIASDHIV